MRVVAGDQDQWQQVFACCLFVVDDFPEVKASQQEVLEFQSCV